MIHTECFSALLFTTHPQEAYYHVFSTSWRIHNHYSTISITATIITITATSPKFKMINPSIPSSPPHRLLIVSNRLPVSIKRTAPHTYTFSQGSGGLVTGLSGLSQSTEFKWYGWTGLEIPKDEEQELDSKLREEFGAVPVFLEETLSERYYNGFSSKLTAGSWNRRA